MEVELRKCKLNGQLLAIKQAYLSLPATDKPDPWKVVLLRPDPVAAALLYDAMADGFATFAGLTVEGQSVSGQVTVRRVLHGQNAELRGSGPLSGA